MDSYDYVSPIQKIVKDFNTRLIEYENKVLMETIHGVGFNVCKDELMKALKYDRKQYEKGYADAMKNAVPLEPLCVWLAGYAAPPNYALDEVCDDSIDPESLVYTANDRAKAWEYHFRELLKSGLMDTEGEDAEEKA